MRAIDLCDILERKYKKGEFQCNMDSCGNKPCDLCTVEKFEETIRADERTKVLDEALNEVEREEMWLYTAIHEDRGNYRYNIDMAFNGLKNSLRKLKEQT